ncbi:4'-phosphopantetheinyl transferase family protein, partial [Bacillus paralicheniformis]|uniref:4'-phosphopantetheinyl transferase family protein n=1 Tax=Bacillus paralicheniformis TaxID=1648923 RepID=UPI0020C0E418
SNTEIGVDIEKRHLLDLNLAQHIISSEEYKDLITLSDKDQLDYFFKLWTLKEAYIKYLGIALSTPLQSLSFKIMAGTIHFHG